MSDAPCPHDDQRSESDCERCAKELLFEAVLEASVDAVVIFDSTNRARFWNQAALHLLGMTESELPTHPTVIRLAAQDVGAEIIHTQVWNSPDTDAPLQNESRLKTRIQTIVIGIAGGEWRLVRLKSDDTTSELYALAHTDELSGLLNRRGFQTKLEKNLGHRICLAIIDIDFFKKINDEFGHHAGDQAIRWIANGLETHFEDAVCIARLGGDEFGVVMNVSERPAESSLKSKNQPASTETLQCRFVECCRAIAESSQLAGSDGNGMTISIGVAIANTSGLPARSMLSAADAAMYRSKKEGRNQVTVVAVEP